MPITLEMESRNYVGIGQAESARRTGSSPSTIARVETGNYESITVAMIVKFGRALVFETKVDFEQVASAATTLY